MTLDAETRKAMQDEIISFRKVYQANASSVLKLEGDMWKIAGEHAPLLSYYLRMALDELEGADTGSE